MGKIKWLIYKITHSFIRFYWRVFKPKTFGARAIVLHADKILLSKNINNNNWSLPGGKKDRGETLKECVLRELKEELDLSVSKTDFELGKYFSNNEGKRDTISVFVLKVSSPSFNKQWEIQDAKWFDLYNLPENLSPATSRRIKEYKNGERNLTSNW